MTCMYDQSLTEASKSALIEVCCALTLYKKDFVLAGGWAPYFLTKNFFDHCGSKDIDIVLKPTIMVKYESIRKTMGKLGYRQTPNPFRFDKDVISPLDKKKYRIDVDFLTEPKAAKRALPLIRVQEDLTACLIEGSSIVFKFQYECQVEGMLPSGGKMTTTINTADIVGSLAMKGLALPRLVDKDSYDIYSISGFCGGDPVKASENYINRVKRVKLRRKEEGIIKIGLNRINQAFGSTESYGVLAVSRFVGSDISTDVFMRVSTFLKNVSSIA